MQIETAIEKPLLSPASDIERPKSPWTPSYSVTTQGPGLTPEEDIPDIEVPPAVVATSIEIISSAVIAEEAPAPTQAPEVPALSVTTEDLELGPVLTTSVR